MPEQFDEPASDETIVAGWGSVAIAGGYPDKLRVIAIPIVPDEECMEAYVDYGGEVYESNMCAGEQGRDHCYVSNKRRSASD